MTKGRSQDLLNKFLHNVLINLQYESNYNHFCNCVKLALTASNMCPQKLICEDGLAAFLRKIVLTCSYVQRA